MQSLPGLFIGSSTESAHVAEALQSVLRGKAEVTLWLDAFHLAEYNLDDLLEQAHLNQFSAFIFAPDDQVLSRGHAQAAVRDNVIYELGLFTAAQGRRNVFVVLPDSELKIPTDILGQSPARYSPPEGAANSSTKWESALHPVARKIEQAMERSLARAERGADVASSGSTGSASLAPQQLLIDGLLVDARRGALPPTKSIRRGALVVHALHGVGQVVGWDTIDPDTTMLHVRFADQMAIVPQNEALEFGNLGI